MEASNMKRNSTTKGAIVLLIGVIIAIVAAAYVVMNPEILEDILYIALIVLAVIVAIALIVFAVMMIMAVPMYAYKGESYQDSSYDLDDVESVKESSSEADNEKR